MSKYCWESGTLQIPTRAWKPLRDALCKAFNDRQDLLFAAALRGHAAVEAAFQQAKAAKQPKPRLSVVIDSQAFLSAIALPRNQVSIDYDETWRIQRALSTQPADRQEPPKLRRPLKKDFAHAVASKQTDYPASDGSIHLDAKAHTLTWTVSDNNHAVEHARASFMGQALFALLNKLEWTRGSGGTIVGNDEYNRDNAHEGGGANYVTARYAFKSKAEREAEAKARAVVSRSYGTSLYSRGWR